MIDFFVKILSPLLLPMGVSQADLTFYLNAISGHLAVIVIAFIIMTAVLIAAVRVKKGWKHFVRLQAVIAFILVALIMVNSICYGPLYNNVSGYLNASKVELADDTVAQSLNTIKKIGEEGIVLVKNNGLLPLSEDVKKLNVFGWSSINPLLGGTGSSASNAATSTDILKSLENAGFEVNQDLSKMYKKYRKERPVIDMNSQDLTLPEPALDFYTDEIINNTNEFSDTAVIVISRPGGEDYDLPMDMNSVIHSTYNVAEEVSVVPGNYTYFNATYENNGDYDDFDEGESYLQLSNTEENMIDLVCSQFNKVIVVINASNPMELNWVDDYDQIGAVLLAPAPGVAGFEALGDILNGSVNPSGRTVDTYVRDLKNTPYINNYGNFSFTNVDDFKKEIAKHDTAYEGSAAFLNYAEGIYVGYKFYETAAEEGLINYEETVQYPFGYGLSYTTFEQKINGFKNKDHEISFQVKVTNTGNAAGKEVVEVYYTPPYINGGIEKASANLIDFGKTGLLKPGDSEEIEFTIPKEEMASYDSEGIKISGGGYILEAGDYTISLRRDSHTVVDSVTFAEESDTDYSVNARSTDLTAATNQFEEYSRGNFEQLSRTDGFANYDAACKSKPAEANFHMDDLTRTAVEASAVGFYDGAQHDRAEAAMPAMGADNGLKLADMVGAEYGDEKWEQLLDNMTFEEMANLVNVGAWQTVEVKSIEKIATSDCDGPAGLNNFVTGAYGTTFPSEILMAQTWNKDMAVEIGASMGSEFAAAKNYGWYGPAMNIHRSAFAGRNFEYYSEDPVLSGYMASGEIRGAAQFGVYPYIKHFALNDQETNRCGILLTYASEQAIREIYLKPFERAVKESQGRALAVMSSFNWIGTIPCYANSHLLNHVLRDEWGFKGMVQTDYDGSYGYMITDNCIRNGGDLMLGFGSFESNALDKGSATLAIQMRRASKNILYTVVNSGYYSEGSPIETENNMDKLFLKINVSVGVVLVLIECLLIAEIILRNRKKKDGSME